MRLVESSSRFRFLIERDPPDQSPRACFSENRFTLFRIILGRSSVDITPGAARSDPASRHSRSKVVAETDADDVVGETARTGDDSDRRDAGKYGLPDVAE